MKQIFRLSFFLVLLFSGCVKEAALKPEATPVNARIVLSPFPEADALFHKDPIWLGGDGASSIDLGNQQILWLFGDTFIGTDGTGNRKKSVMIRNSIALQSGYDPVNASIRFYFGKSNSRPMPYFHFPLYGEVWPSTGILVQDTLFVFLMTIVTVNDALGFGIETWHCVSVKDRSPSPELWDWNPVDTPSLPPKLPLILSFVFSEKDHIYGFLTHQKTHEVYLCRWWIHDFLNEHLVNPSWWYEKERRWIDGEEQKAGAGLTPLFSGGQMEFTVEWQPLLKRYLLVQTQGFGNAEIGIRTANSVTGPWSPFSPLFSPDILGRRNLLIYAAKNHPEQKGGAFVFTYAVNSLDFNEVLLDNTLYFPHFLKGWIVDTP